MAAVAASVRAARAAALTRPLSWHRVAMMSTGVGRRTESLFPPSTFPPAPDHHAGAVSDEIERLRAELNALPRRPAAGGEASVAAPEELEERLNRISQRLENTLFGNPVLRRALHAPGGDPILSTEMERIQRKKAAAAASSASQDETGAGAAAADLSALSREERVVEEANRLEAELIRERWREQLREMDEQDREHYISMFRMPARPESPFFFMGKQTYHGFLEELDTLLHNIREAAKDPARRREIWGNVSLDRFGIDADDDGQAAASAVAERSYEEEKAERIARARAHASAKRKAAGVAAATEGDRAQDDATTAAANGTEAPLSTRTHSRIDEMLDALSPAEPTKEAPPSWQPREFFEEHLGVLLRAKQYRAILQRLNELASLPPFPQLDMYLLTFQPPGKRLQHEPRQWTVDGQGRMYATGRRKTAVARVWIRRGEGHFTVNNQVLSDYFPRYWHVHDVIRPFEVTNTYGKYDVRCTVQGGGKTGQAQAIRHGLSIALKRMEPSLKQALKAEALLTRDDRIVERKKYGRKKARKSFTWVKR